MYLHLSCTGQNLKTWLTQFQSCVQNWLAYTCVCACRLAGIKIQSVCMRSCVYVCKRLETGWTELAKCMHVCMCTPVVQTYIYIYIYTHTHMHISHTYVIFLIVSKSEKELCGCWKHDPDMQTHTHIHTYTNTCTNLYYDLQNNWTRETAVNVFEVVKPTGNVRWKISDSHSFCKSQYRHVCTYISLCISLHTCACVYACICICM